MSLLSVGQPCFAKVKGFPAWPAEVTAIQGTNKYEVFFFGTSEIASVGHNNVWEASPANMAKFITPKVKKRKFYAVGVEEMNKLIKKQQSHSRKSDHSYSSPSKSSRTASPTKNTSVVIMETLTTHGRASKSPVKTAQKPKSPVKTAQKPKSPVKAAQKLKSPVKSVSIPKSPVKTTTMPKSPVKAPSVSEPLAPSNKENHKPRTEESNQTDRAVAPTEKTLPRRSSKTTSRASPKPAEKIPIAETSEKPSRRSAKRAIEETEEETKQTEKKKKTEATERIKVNIQLEMSEDAFLRVAKELPAILALTGHPIDLNMEVQKK